MNAGVECVTCGDHVWRRKEILPVLERDKRCLRPLNYPVQAVGRGMTILETRLGIRIGVATLVGRIFMGPADCPFQAAQRAFEFMQPEAKVRFIEIHAEATSEKIARLKLPTLAGRPPRGGGPVPHVPTADERGSAAGNRRSWLTRLALDSYRRYEAPPVSRRRHALPRASCRVKPWAVTVERRREAPMSVMLPDGGR